jgi:hypothetical protein
MTELEFSLAEWKATFDRVGQWFIVNEQEVVARYFNIDKQIDGISDLVASLTGAYIKRGSLDDLDNFIKSVFANGLILP